ncbi:protein phosphatase regulator [Colletotrichum plurivorum]|uniref:Protein phosphatase regulator n=1 Tax=Colletotrichum plurivorum TaxID=2175906 RepID=A0A8H6JJ54_9PEZI|nr:protein phosphatase regulator [Colletotrichum plurivorum]
MPLVEILSPKPPLLRKRSGELVRPVLQPSSRRRPATAPATPSAKAVHFDDSRMEQVLCFRAHDSPESLSPTNPDRDDDDSDIQNASACCCYELDPTLSDLPRSSPARLRQMVRLDAVFLSDDGRSLAGFVEVANLAYEKAVVCRFSFDGWETVSEVAADYSAPVYPGPGRPGSYDGFVFSIDLGGLVSVASRTMELCVRYMVDGKQFWDNNDFANFRIRLERRCPEARGQDMDVVPFECQLRGRSGYRMSPWSSLGLEPIEFSQSDARSTASNGTCR